MATLSSTVSLKYPKSHGGGGAGIPPTPGGGDGDGRAGGSSPNYGQRLRRARLGLIVGLTPVIMLFVSFTSAYIVRQGLPTLDLRTNTYVHDWLPVRLPWELLLINTVVLLASSLTMELSRRQITRQAALAPVRSIPGVSLGEERSRPWLAITVVLGLGFLAGQWLAWWELESRGFYLATSASSSFVYLLTGMHAIHLAGGILALLYAATTSLLRKPVEARRIVVDITSWYWHFMALLWIYIFALLEIAH
jgi:cytochrome c oxidase subunit III